MSTIRENSSFHVGDRVRIDLGRHKLTGVVVEERGPLGVRGRNVYQVRVPMDPLDPMMVELPEDEIEAVAAETAATSSIEKEKVIEYLSNGGLISILKSNRSGGKNQPRAWLCLDN